MSALGFLDLRPTLSPTPEPASDVLTPPVELLLLADRLAALYEIVFPADEAYLDEEVAEWHSEEAVAAAVERFLERVNILFPVHEECWEIDLESIEWRLYEIPVIPIGYDEHEEAWEDWTEPVPYLLHMRYSRAEPPDTGGGFATQYPAYDVPRRLEPFRLGAALREMELPEPLDGLPDLLAMLAHDSGNWWLDMGELAMMETGGYPPWTAENVAWLAAEWQEAQPALARVNRLLDWRNGSPAEIAQKLTAVRAALLEAAAR